MKNNTGFWTTIKNIFSGGEGAAYADIIHHQSVSEFKNTIRQKGAVLVDVRTPKEYREGHIPGAKMIDWKAKTFRELIVKIPKGKPVLVYCRSGVRSGNAAKLMATLGFKNIYNLKRGINQWKAEGGKIKRK